MRFITLYTLFILITSCSVSRKDRAPASENVHVLNCLDGISIILNKYKNKEYRSDEFFIKTLSEIEGLEGISHNPMFSDQERAYFGEIVYAFKREGYDTSFISKSIRDLIYCE